MKFSINPISYGEIGSLGPKVTLHLPETPNRFIYCILSCRLFISGQAQDIDALDLENDEICPSNPLVKKTPKSPRLKAL